MAEYTYGSYRDELLPGIVAFWNRVFAERRNFFPVTEKMFRERIVEKKTAVETFRPGGFLVARREEEVVGVLHAGRNSPEVCKVLNPDWPGGEQGYIALLMVDPAHRKKGIGTALWHGVREFLDGCVQVVVDGQCLNPFYGNSQGPFTPFWGTPEGISVLWKDSATKKFFAQKGYAPRYKAVQMELAVQKAPAQDVEKLEADLKARGVEIKTIHDSYPEVGGRVGDSDRKVEGLVYECLTAIDGDRVAAVLTTYPMVELALDRHAIYEAIVHEDYRARGIGKGMLSLAIERLRAQGSVSCSVLTIPDVSEAAFKMYDSAGFQPCESWAVY